MQLDAAAPIVRVADNDIRVTENMPVTLTATTSAGTIAWYEAGVAIGTGTELAVTLSLGTHQISAIATDEAGLIGMAGVVVNVAAPTKFYVVDDATLNQTFEYSATGALNESYSLNSGNTARAVQRAQRLVTRPGSWMLIATYTSTTPAVPPGPPAR